MKIAIVGSGIAGLSAAWLLGQDHEVTLFEKQARPGMGSFNLDFEDAGRLVRIDLPLRAFSAGHYVNLVALYRRIGVAIERADHSSSYSAPGGQRPYFGYRYRHLGRLILPLPVGLPRVSAGLLRIVRDAARFQWLAARDRRLGRTDGLTLGAYLRQEGYGDDFVRGVLYPSLAAICTCGYDAVEAYPAETVIDFMAGGLLFNEIWRAALGADDAIARLLQPCQVVRCGVQVAAVAADAAGVLVREADGARHRFDHVVIATQANQVAPLLAGAPAEAAILALLARIPYEATEVVVHGDDAVVPGREADRAPVNFLVDPRQPAPMASIWLNRIYGALKGCRNLYQTVNPLIEPRPETILGRARFERPVVTLDSLAAIRQIGAAQGAAVGPVRRIWYCGSYAMPGIPLQESAVQSSLAIARALSGARQIKGFPAAA